jgi:hypothetical protein
VIKTSSWFINNFSGMTCRGMTCCSSSWHHLPQALRQPRHRMPGPVAIRSVQRLRPNCGGTGLTIHTPAAASCADVVWLSLPAALPAPATAKGGARAEPGLQAGNRQHHHKQSKGRSCSCTVPRWRQSADK